ncbi:hypothetical protein CWI36_0032p0020 [Hamiltosporidium magnivora]|uniref:Uncharacterized protein n=1 Tax=Hamiltosporidium magnivora TaxID=148818 RepID=A0A4Q9LM19_9MICR|nr:hypothetical protein CWI36_0032p0020 [Hamiltosporidium magnivora]
MHFKNFMVLFSGFLNKKIGERYTNVTNQAESCFTLDANNRKRHRYNEFLCTQTQQCSFDFDKKNSNEYFQQEDNNISNKIPRLDSNVKRLDSTNNTSKNVDSNMIYYGDNIQNLEEPDVDASFEILADSENENSLLFKTPVDIIIFEYSNSYVIRSMYFDNCNSSEINEIYLNIKDITKGNIDIHMFKECLNILCYGWNYGVSGLNNENFLDFIQLLSDLSCYSESDALITLYKNLLPFLFSYAANISRSNVFNLPEIEFIKYREYFLPFLTVLYASVDIFFTSNTKELVFIEKNEIRKLYLDGMISSEKIIIRTTPIALKFMYKDYSKDKKIILSKLVFSYEILGIRISSDDRYYTACKNSDIANLFLKRNAGICDVKTFFFSVFYIHDFKKNEQIKYIEFERIDLTYDSRILGFGFYYLETLILVKCKFNKYPKVLSNVSFYFPNLKILRIIGFGLTNRFFNNLNYLKIETLDISGSNYVGSNLKFCINLPKLLKEFRMDHSYPNYNILNSMILNDNLAVLSMRGVDFTCLKNFTSFRNGQKYFHCLDLSGCILDDSMLNFFSINIRSKILILEGFANMNHLQKILNQESLYASVRCLILSKDSLTLNIFDFLCKFKILEYLKISNLSINLLAPFVPDCRCKGYISEIDLSENKLSIFFLYFLCQFHQLKMLSLSMCNLETAFMEILCSTNLSTSLKNLNIAGKRMSELDIQQIALLKNLNILFVSFDDSVFSGSLRKYGALKSPNLEFLILVFTNVNCDIANFVIMLSSLKSLNFVKCKLNDDVLIINFNLYPPSLKSITFTKTFIPENDRFFLDVLRNFGIQVIIN